MCVCALPKLRPCKTVTFSILACLCFVNDEEISLTNAEIADALNREDELGKLVFRAFSFDIPPFNKILIGIAPGSAEKEKN